MKQKYIFLAVTVMLACTASLLPAQEDTGNRFSVSGYADIYYQYDANHTTGNSRPSFIYSYNRNNEVSLNLGYIKVAWVTEKTRANLALAAGTYMNANYAAENGVMKNVLEANAGLKLSRKANLWLDAGILPSHIGFESAVSKDCRTFTRSLLADNSPYYETGARLGYTSANEQWYIAAFVLNGWQRIQRVPGNTTPAFGTQVTYKPSSSVTLNSSSFAGNDQPDSTRRMRWFHNLYGIFRLNSKWEATLGFDIGVEQKAKYTSSVNTWYSPVAILRCQAGPRTAVTGRAEYYRDRHGVIIAQGARIWGFSLNVDYAITQNMLWRTECKQYTSADAVFEQDNKYVRNALSFITGLAVSF